MNIDPYYFKYDSQRLLFTFQSKSDLKIVDKIISYDPIPDFKNIYNLLLGDVLDDGTISDISISNNDDLNKILSTVIHSMMIFLEERPDCQIYFTGSTDARTRLYRIAISNYLFQFENHLIIEGLLDNSKFEQFQKGKNYIGFLISLKKS